MKGKANKQHALFTLGKDEIAFPTVLKDGCALPQNRNIYQEKISLCHGLERGYTYYMQ